MSGIPSKTFDYLKLLRDGSHYSERRGSITYLINHESGAIVAAFSGVNELTALVPVSSPDGSESWVLPNSAVTMPTNAIQYNPVTLQLLCQRIAEGGSLTKLCHLPDMPSYNTLAVWRRKIPEVREALEQAYLDRADYLRDKALDAALEADEGSVDSSKLHFEALKWAASVDSPRYSPKAKVDMNVAAPVQVLVVDTGIRRGDSIRDINNIEEQLPNNENDKTITNPQQGA